jgi:HKD family nuclease
MVIRKITVLILAAFILSTTPSFATPADVQNISSDKYFDTALNEINQAQSSIFLVMYLISITPDQPESQPSRLLKALINAKDRGVDVKVILDQSINFETDSLDDAVLTNKNQQSYELLKKNGVSVFFDESQTFTHAKTLVIDNKTVLIGSSNWSKSALTRNNETNVLIRSEAFAQEIIKDLNQIKIQENVPAILTPSVSISQAIISNKKMLSQMASQSDERASDTYLYLLKEYDGNPDRKVSLNYNNLAKALAIDQMPVEDYRRQITKVLEKLDNKYNLIKFQKPLRNQNAVVKLNPEFSTQKLEIPTTFWRYNWNKTLSFPAKVMYLINLSYAQSSPSGRFSISREKLSKTHDLSESFISEGNQALRKLNLLDIEYGDLEDLKFNERKANTYTLQELYNPKDLKEELNKLEQKHGQQKLDRAVKTASLVFEENNPKTIQALIDLEDQYGQAIIEEASKKISEKNPDNPKRSAGYLINTIKNIAQQTPLVAPARIAGE